MIDPREDGISHINVYSKGVTELGRYLSNFSDCFVETEDGSFRTVEGYWYWLGCHDDRLRDTNGWDSKKLGRQLGVPDYNKSQEFQRKISKAIITKIDRPWCNQELIRSGSIPFVHYYVYGSKVVVVKEGLWMVDLITSFRYKLIKENKS